MLQTASVMDNAAQQTEMCSKTCCTQFHLTTLLCMCQACHICKQGICQQWYTLFIKREVKVQYTTIDVTAAAWRNECSICFVVTRVPKDTCAPGPLSSCILLAKFIVKKALQHWSEWMSSNQPRVHFFICKVSGNLVTLLSKVNTLPFDHWQLHI